MGTKLAVNPVTGNLDLIQDLSNYQISGPIWAGSVYGVISGVTISYIGSLQGNTGSFSEKFYAGSFIGDGTAITGIPTANQINKSQDNMILTNLRLQEAGSLIYGQFEDGWSDKFMTQSGVDTTNSINQNYSTDHYYEPTSSVSSPDLYTGMVIHYKCNDNAANKIVVDSISAINGSSNQNTSLLSKAGKIISGLDFNGNGDKILSSGATIFNTIGSGNFGVAFWIYPKATSSVEFIGNQNTTSSLGKVRFYTEGGTSRLVAQLNDGAHQLVQNGIILDASAWQYLAFTRVSGTTYVYKNGSMVLSGTYATAVDTSVEPLRIGYNPWGGGVNYVSGIFDDIRIYNSRGFTQTDINNLYSGGTGTEYEGSGATGGYNNMTLISIGISGQAIPSSSRIVVLEENIGGSTVTLNTDLLAYSSRDGTNYTQHTLSNVGDFGGSKNIIIAETNFSTASGQIMKWKLTTANAAPTRVHGVGLIWE